MLCVVRVGRAEFVEGSPTLGQLPRPLDREVEGPRGRCGDAHTAVPGGMAEGDRNRRPVAADTPRIADDVELPEAPAGLVGLDDVVARPRFRVVKLLHDAAE